MKKQSIVSCVSFALIVLWTYAAVSKLSDINLFNRQMLSQPFNENFSHILVYLIPFIEVFTAFLLSFRQSRIWGLWFSTGCMMVFTVYAAMVVFGFFAITPCSCGGLLNKMSWTEHFYFNLFWLVASIAALLMQPNAWGIKNKSHP